MQTECSAEPMLFARLDRRDLVADFGGGGGRVRRYEPAILGSRGRDPLALQGALWCLGPACCRTVARRSCWTFGWRRVSRQTMTLSAYSHRRCAVGRLMPNR